MIALQIARTELLRTGRDPTLLFFAVVLPVLIIVVIGATIGTGPRALPVQVLDADGSAASARVVAALADSPALTTTVAQDRQSLDAAVRSQSAAGGVELPKGFGEALDAGVPVEVVLVAPTTSGATPALLSAVSGAVGDDAVVEAGARFAAGQVDVPLERARSAAEEIAAAQGSVGVAVEVIGEDPTRVDNQYAYTAPSNLVLFVFINSLAGGAALAETRRLGVLRRMYAAPVRASTLVVGAGLARLVFALAQALLILAVGAWGFGVRWGSPLGATALVAAFALVATGAGLLVGAVARDPDRAQAIGVPVAIGLAMLGGCMWPLEVVPEPLRVVGHVTPHAWAMDGWVALVFEGASFSTVIPQVAVLLVYGVVLVALASWRLRQVLTT